MESITLIDPGCGCKRLIIEVKRPGPGTVDAGCCGQVAVCARFPPKMHDGNRDSAVPDLLCDLSKQRVARLRQRATQMQQLRWSEHSSPLSGSLN
jgi:hypothetical protein